MTAATKTSRARDQRAAAAKRARFRKFHGAELGYRPKHTLGQWQRTPPIEKGVYPICSREGGLWTGSIALNTQGWCGYWWSEPIRAGMDLTSLPPCPAWTETGDSAQHATL